MWDAIQVIVAYWPYILGTIGVVLLVTIGQYAYKLGGIPALVVAVGAIAGGLGYYLGQNGKGAAVGLPTHPSVRQPKRRRPTIFDVGRSIFDT